MKLKDIKNSLNEISAIGGLKQVVKGNTDRVEGIKLSKEMAQAMIDWFNSSPYGRKYPKAAKARLHISLGIMMSFGLDRYAKFKGAKEELKHIKALSKAMRDNVNEEEGVKHYTKDGKEWTGPTHKMPDGTLMTQNPHSDDSEKLFHKAELDESLNEGKFKVDDLVYNKRTKTVGIVRIADDKSGEAKTDADGNVNVDELEKYNPIKFKHQSKAKAAPSTQKEVSKRGLFNPFKSESVVNEGKYDGMLDVIEDLVSKASSFMDVGNQLKKQKIKYSFSTSMMPIYRLDKLPIAIVNKSYAKPNKAAGDRVVGDIVIGLMESIKESVVNEAKYDIGMARKGNGLTIYNKAEEENGDYKNVALIDNKGKIKYLDKKIPSNVKKQIEKEAKKMMEITKEGTMKLSDLLKESFEKGKVYSNPFHTPFVKENDNDRREESSEMSNEQKQAFLEAVKSYKTFGESIYRKEGLSKVYESIRNLVESAGKNMVKETEGSFDGITVSRHVKRMNESFKVFEKTLREVGTLQQRLESSYDEIGETLGKYYEINETEEKDIEEGNEFGASRAKAIANGDSDFEVDGKTYPVKSVDKDDKENAKEFANESKGNKMKLKDLLNESFGFGELPSSKLMKMKVSAKEMLDSVKNKKVNESEEVEEDVIKEGFSTWEMRFSDMNLGGVKLSKKNVYKVKARNTVEAIKKAAKMAGVEKNWIATETHSLKKIG
jgi:hypothetical protein